MAYRVEKELDISNKWRINWAVVNGFWGILFGFAAGVALATRYLAHNSDDPPGWVILFGIPGGVAGAVLGATCGAIRNRLWPR